MLTGRALVDNLFAARCRMTTMFLGLTLALASALATNLSFPFKQRGAVLAAPIHVRHPVKSASGLFRSRWFAIGWAVSVLAWLMHVGALSRAPLSTVQAVLSGGRAGVSGRARRTLSSGFTSAAASGLA